MELEVAILIANRDKALTDCQGSYSDVDYVTGSQVPVPKTEAARLVGSGDYSWPPDTGNKTEAPVPDQAAAGTADGTGSEATSGS